LNPSPFLAAIRDQPLNPGPLEVFADWLDEQPTEPVRPSHLPNWLRLAWLRNVRSPGLWGLDRRDTTGWAVAEEIQGLMLLDHWGSVRIGTLTAFVNEPYIERAVALADFQDLASLVGGVAAFRWRSEWGHGTESVLLFPNPGSPALSTNAPAVGVGYTGWTRCDATMPWQLTCTANTERACRRVLHAALEDEDGQLDLLVTPTGVNPNRPLTATTMRVITHPSHPDPQP
jgi:uncharacterized protein (TIGR02996 family)